MSTTMREQVSVAIIGAGSVQFSQGTIGDLLLSDVICGTAGERLLDLRLMDIKPAHLVGVERFAGSAAALLKRRLRLTVTSDLRTALDGAEFVITAIEVERYLYWAQDYHIPRKYGFVQIYGENGGPGGMFHALRNMGPMLHIAATMQQLCPDAWLINYSNPEAKLVQAIAALTPVKVAGMCHGVFMGREQLSKLLELPEELLVTEACGLNHFAWFQSIRHRETGEDLYPLLRWKERQAHWLARWDELALLRLMFRTYGLWPYPGTNHCGEYLRWANGLMANEGMQFFYDPAAEHPWQERSAPAFVYDLAGRPTETPLFGAENVKQVYPTWESVSGGESLQPSGEEGVRIIEGMMGETPLAIATTNMRNGGCIPNLPDDMVVEAPAIADAQGLHLQPMQRLPTAIAAMTALQGQINSLLIEAYAEQSRRKLLQALLLDPTVSTYHNAVALIDEMCALQQELLPPLHW